MEVINTRLTMLTSLCPINDDVWVECMTAISDAACDHFELIGQTEEDYGADHVYWRAFWTSMMLARTDDRAVPIRLHRKNYPIWRHWYFTNCKARALVSCIWGEF